MDDWKEFSAKTVDEALRKRCYILIQPAKNWSMK